MKTINSNTKLKAVSNLQAYKAYSAIEVIDRIIGGEKALFELIMRRYNRCLFRVARSIVQNNILAQDVVQEAYINAFRNLIAFRGPAGFRAWLIQITYREALRILRKESVFRALDYSDLEDVHTPHGKY